MAFNTFIFDFDGVLFDSGLTYLWFCEQEAKKYGVKIPKKTLAETWAGTMEKFLENIGFSEELIPRIILDSEKSFPHYMSQLFEGIPELLAELKERGNYLAIASYNITTNVFNGISKNERFFDKINTWDTHRFKSDGIREIMECAPGKHVFVGDTESDYNAARRIGISFVGSGYGWGFQEYDPRFIVARDVGDLRRILLG